MPDTAITLTAAPDFTGLRLTRNAAGYVHSPWFTFEWREGRPGEEAYDLGGKYHVIQHQAKAAFAAAIGLQPRQILVTESRTICPGEIWWRLGTAVPVPDPIRRISPIRPSLELLDP